MHLVDNRDNLQGKQPFYLSSAFLCNKPFRKGENSKRKEFTPLGKQNYYVYSTGSTVIISAAGSKVVPPWQFFSLYLLVHVYRLLQLYCCVLSCLCSSSLAYRIRKSGILHRHIHSYPTQGKINIEESVVFDMHWF